MGLTHWRMKGWMLCGTKGFRDRLRCAWLQPAQHLYAMVAAGGRSHWRAIERGNLNASSCRKPRGFVFTSCHVYDVIYCINALTHYETPIA